MMIGLVKFPTGEPLEVDASAIESVHPMVDRLHSRQSPIAEIVMRSGERFTVCDYGRQVSKRIKAAKQGGDQPEASTERLLEGNE